LTWTQDQDEMPGIANIKQFCDCHAGLKSAVSYQKWLYADTSKMSHNYLVHYCRTSAAGRGSNTSKRACEVW